LSFIHVQKEDLPQLKTFCYFCHIAFLNFKIFFPTVLFTNFGRATKEMSHFIFSEVSCRKSLLFNIIICYHIKCSRTHYMYLL